jgi:programmed cell death 6-interacting protein
MGCVGDEFVNIHGGQTYSTLASMNLPGSIEALEQPIGLPQVVFQRSEEVRGQGGARGLQEQWDTLQSLAKQDGAILDEVTDP